MNKTTPFTLIISIALLGASCREKQTATAGLPQVPEGYTVEVAAGPDLLDYPMFATLDETGRLFVFESTGNVYPKTDSALKNPQFRIRLLEDTNDDGVYDKSTVFADKVGFPQGGVFYKGSLYATSAPDLLKFTDTDGDGVADQREVLLSGWTLNVNANSLIGPFMAPDGWLYMTSAIEGFDVTSKEGVRMKGETARIWRVRTDGSGLEWISAGGMNNPVELTFTAAGEPIGTETYFTDPKAGERDALVYWTEGGVYPKPNSNIDRDKLVRTGDLMPVVSKYSRVSPAGIGRYRNTVLGDDFKDNLFSAQFNTHRIIRHKLFREGASFRTEDEPFFWSDNEDFHPTDVLEDADGSLLVVETGGWFIKGCPLSQVSKPELKGSIYRVRRKGVKKADDSYGNAVQWETVQPSEAAKYLESGNAFVSDRAVQRLVDAGKAAIEPIKNLFQQASPVEAKVKAVFALYRIGTPEALVQVRTALSDADQQVRISAARAAGLARDVQAVDKLIELVVKSDPAVRRQAATALGQIKDKKAIGALLNAAGDTDDRFIRHAIIYALVSINEPALVALGLADASAGVQEAALIALDQMPSAALEAKQLTPFLTANNISLKHTALWIAAHHPEWSADMVRFLRNRFQRSPLSREEEQLFGNILVSFCGDTRMQQFIADQFRAATPAHKLFLLASMEACGAEQFPGLWTTQLQQQLAPGTDARVQSRVMQLVRLRGLTSLSKQLQQVADNTGNTTELRVEAIATLLKAEPRFTNHNFDYLYSVLQGEKEASLRQEVATTLTQGELSEKQLLQLSAGFLPVADAFILPRIVPVFKGAHSVETGRALAAALAQSPSLSGFTAEYLEKIFEQYPDEVKSATAPLMAKLHEVRADRLKRLEALEKNVPNGSLDSGRALFFGKATCSTCHTIGPEGGHFGPDLTSIQLDRSAHDLLEAIVYPSASFVREFESYRIKTKDGEHTGIIRERTPDAVILATSAQTAVRIARADILATEILDMSLMPQGFDQLLNNQEMADLMAFILGQDQDPKTDQQLLR
ncbi:PVC-type heme-binding CxxCH protein [Agriterribacter sp.]|uniref:PVC-type heme-binding CxxCH protein n=1 Tax=Agriterribacter sp. TaxID=2821509 RepID=UPI002C9A5218|nr:PVC-type heme-binding CxxCH protein [Agriterribacter sp.]HRO44289.1 HEAT repeat domain-containing protein [Agriterribacter sp.]HRQ18241.1 HEAT repeat domain-containing protein [Agriterribacter sp.]